MGKDEILFQAAEKGNFKKVRKLLSSQFFGLVKPADVNARDNNQFTPLFFAAQNGHMEIVKLLLKAGADVDAKSIHAVTPLMVSAEYGHEHIVRLLLESGAQVNASKTGEDVGWTPLIFASFHGHIKTVKLLVENGANVNDKSEDSLTPLMASAKYGFIEVVSFLLEHGAAIHVSKTGNESGWTALMFAAWQGHADVVELLITKGALVDVSTPNQWTPLMWAAMEGHTDVINLLLKHGARHDPVNDEQWTPLLLAAREGHKKVVELLLRKGANPLHRQKDGWTPLFLAANNGYTDIVKVLVTHGVDIHVKDARNKTALSAAMEKGHTAVVRLLKKQGAELPEKSTGTIPDITPVHLSITLIDSKRLGDAGPGGSLFQDAIQSLNDEENDEAAREFKQAIKKGLDTLRLGYAYANLGTIKLKKGDLMGAIEDYFTVFSYDQALYESVHEAAQYLYIVYNELGRSTEAQGLKQLYSRTSSKLGMSLSPDMANKVKRMVKFEKDTLISKKKVKPLSKEVPLTQGLRPLGNKKRLTSTHIEEARDAYFLLFGNKVRLERYYDEFIKYARKTPPPIVFEVLAAFAPTIIFEEKYAFTYPNPRVDNREAYQIWMQDAIYFCNDRVLPDNHTDFQYQALGSHVEEIFKWDILVPVHFNIFAAAAKAFLSDPENGGHPEIKILAPTGIEPKG